jgi:hypothetical protein
MSTDGSSSVFPPFKRQRRANPILLASVFPFCRACLTADPVIAPFQCLHEYCVACAATMFNEGMQPPCRVCNARPDERQRAVLHDMTHARVLMPSVQLQPPCVIPSCGICGVLHSDVPLYRIFGCAHTHCKCCILDQCALTPVPHRPCPTCGAEYLGPPYYKKARVSAPVAALPCRMCHTVTSAADSTTCCAPPGVGAHTMCVTCFLLHGCCSAAFTEAATVRALMSSSDLVLNRYLTVIKRGVEHRQLEADQAALHTLLRELHSEIPIDDVPVITAPVVVESFGPMFSDAVASVSAPVADSPCIICDAVTSAAAGIRCSAPPGAGAHTICLTCFLRYVEVTTSSRRMDNNPAVDVVITCPRVIHGQRLQSRLGEGGCRSAAFTEAAVLRALSMAESHRVFDDYMTTIKRGVAHRQYEADQAECYTLLRKRDIEIPIEWEVQQLMRACPVSYMCGRCGFGPILHTNCDNLATHHLQKGNYGGGVVVSNACPRCNWFVDNIRAWPRWKGTTSSLVGHSLDAGATRPV